MMDISVAHLSPASAHDMKTLDMRSSVKKMYKKKPAQKACIKSVNRSKGVKGLMGVSLGCSALLYRRKRCIFGSFFNMYAFFSSFSLFVEDAN